MVLNKQKKILITKSSCPVSYQKIRKNLILFLRITTTVVTEKKSTETNSLNDFSTNSRSKPCNHILKIRKTHNHEDWVQIRECLVKSFIKYPLYSYMVATDDRKLGEKFLRAYLEANYDATVESGKAVLMCVKEVFRGNCCL